MGMKKELESLISDKTGFKTKTVQRDKAGHYIVVKGSIDQEDITLINIYAPNIGAPKYVKERLLDLKREIDCSTLIVGDLNTALSPLDRSSRQKIGKEIKDLNNIINQMCQGPASVWVGYLDEGGEGEKKTEASMPFHAHPMPDTPQRSLSEG